MNHKYEPVINSVTLAGEAAEIELRASASASAPDSKTQEENCIFNEKCNRDEQQD
jgi:hypothetical protein